MCNELAELFDNIEVKSVITSFDICDLVRITTRNKSSFKRLFCLAKPIRFTRSTSKVRRLYDLVHKAIHCNLHLDHANHFTSYYL